MDYGIACNYGSPVSGHGFYSIVASIRYNVGDGSIFVDPEFMSTDPSDTTLGWDAQYGVVIAQFKLLTNITDDSQAVTQKYISFYGCAFNVTSSALVDGTCAQNDDPYLPRTPGLTGIILPYDVYASRFAIKPSDLTQIKFPVQSTSFFYLLLVILLLCLSLAVSTGALCLYWSRRRRQRQTPSAILEVKCQTEVRPQLEIKVPPRGQSLLPSQERSSQR
jgi:hypothetical protein